ANIRFGAITIINFGELLEFLDALQLPVHNRILPPSSVLTSAYFLDCSVLCFHSVLILLSLQSPFSKQLCNSGVVTFGSLTKLSQLSAFQPDREAVQTTLTSSLVSTVYAVRNSWTTNTAFGALLCSASSSVPAIAGRMVGRSATVLASARPAKCS